MNSSTPGSPPPAPPPELFRGTPAAPAAAPSLLRRRIGIVVLFLLLALGAFSRAASRHYAVTDREERAALPAIGATGELRDVDHPSDPVRFCPPTNPAEMTWPCKGDAKAQALPAGTQVQVFKADVVIGVGLCRIAVAGGPNDRYVGDGPCRFVHVLTK